MRYLVLGVLACLCSGLAWAEVDETLGKSKATHINAQKLAKPSSKASPKLTPAELAKLATEKEIAQRRAAFVPTSAVATTAATATLSPAAAPQPNPALDAAAPATMPEAQAAVTGDVHVGRMVCELGNAVSVTPDPSRLGTYWVQMRQHRYHMTPVATSTGAVRLEDKQAGAMWLQLPHKSMLMNSKIGQRMADECQSAHQFDEASRMKSGPPSTLLDGPSLAKK